MDLRSDTSAGSVVCDAAHARLTVFRAVAAESG